MMDIMQDSSPSSSSSWIITYTKLRFFTRIRRFLRAKTTAGKKYSPPQRDHFAKETRRPGEEESSEVMVVRRNDNEAAAGLVELQRAVKRLHFGSWEEKEMAAQEVKGFCKEGLKTRKLLAELGVIPCLVDMVESDDVCRRRVAVQALVQLANGTYTNRALMVEAGILTKLPKNLKDGMDELTMLDFAQLLLSVSSLCSSAQFLLPSSQILPFVTSVLESNSNTETIQACLGTIYNLSTTLDNAASIVASGLVHTLLKFSSRKETSEKSLATLGNLVVTNVGKRAMEDESSMVPDSLIEVMTWEENAKCQELSAYILMILAHQSSVQRTKMAKSGIVPVLLEVALLSTPLAQKRAMKLLQWFKDERQAKMGPHSGPQMARHAVGSSVNQRETQEGKRLMKKMVKESLHKNMEVITRRANANESSKLKELVISSSSKSLPY